MRCLITALVLCLVCPMLFAQYTNFSTGNRFNNPGSALIDSFIRSKMNQQMLEASLKKKNQPAEPAAKPASFDYSKSLFKGSGVRVFPDIVAKNAEDMTEAERKQLAVDLCGAIDEFERQTGTKNNLAYGISFMLGISLKVTKNVELSDEDLEQLAQAVHRQIEADAEWSKMTDEQKQLMYESSLVDASIIITTAQRGDEKSLQQAKEKAAECLNQFGIKN